MARQIILLCDGTNNNLTGWQADTHVVLLAELLQAHPDPDRIVYYDPGVGNPGQLPGTTVVDKLRRAGERLDGLAFGRGVFDNIAEGYRFLMQKWEPGDEIFVFGFSRGAFTARSIAGMVNAFGIIHANQDTLVQSLVATYFSKPTEDQKRVRQQASRLFGKLDADGKPPVVHFTGVWDTVASVGLPPFDLRISARPNLDHKRFRHVRQALALDEHRAQFKPRAYAQDDGGFPLEDGSPGSVKQRWFRGSHCDVGGGNPFPRSGLSQAPFCWMVAQAMDCGLRMPATADGQSVAGADTVQRQAAVLARLGSLRPEGIKPPGDPHLNSQIWSQPLWALTGLAVRDTDRAAIDGEPVTPVTSRDHPSVQRWAQKFPLGTVWKEHWSLGRHAAMAVVLMAGLFVFLLMAQRQLFLGDGLPSLSLASIRALFDGNLRFQAWQLALLTPMDAWKAELASFLAPGAAVAWDFLFIGLLAFLLAHLVTPAFARLASLRHAMQAAPRWLNAAGWALPVAIGADLAEDLLTALLLYAAGQDWSALLVLWPLRIAVCLASLLKFAGLLGVLALLVMSWTLPLRRARVTAPPPEMPGPRAIS